MIVVFLELYLQLEVVEEQVCRGQHNHGSFERIEVANEGENKYEKVELLIVSNQFFSHAGQEPSEGKLCLDERNHGCDQPALWGVAIEALSGHDHDQCDKPGVRWHESLTDGSAPGPKVNPAKRILDDEHENQRPEESVKALNTKELVLSRYDLVLNLKRQQIECPVCLIVFEVFFFKLFEMTSHCF